jgi:hypothetical protein
MSFPGLILVSSAITFPSSDLQTCSSSQNAANFLWLILLRARGKSCLIQGLSWLLPFIHQFHLLLFSPSHLSSSHSELVFCIMWLSSVSVLFLLLGMCPLCPINICLVFQGGENFMTCLYSFICTTPILDACLYLHFLLLSSTEISFICLGLTAIFHFTCYLKMRGS